MKEAKRKDETTSAVDGAIAAKAVSDKKNSDGAMSQEEVLEKYADIIDLPRPKMRHPRMSREERAAQFAPFAALVGFARRVQESGAEFLEEVENEEEILAEFGEGEINEDWPDDSFRDL